MSLGGDLMIPARTSSDGMQHRHILGERDGGIELGANVVNTRLAVLHDDGVQPHILPLIRRKMLLRVLQVGTQEVDVVQHRGRTHRLRVGLEALDGLLVQLVELTHHSDHGRHVGVVLGGTPELGDLVVDLELLLAVRELLNDQVQDPQHDDQQQGCRHDDGQVVGQELVESAHGVLPFVSRCGYPRL